jgi:hypothetical protein
MFAHERHFVTGEGLPLAKSRRDNAADAADGRLWLCGFAGIVRPIASDRVAKVKAVDGVGKVAHEVGAAEFAVGVDRDSDLTLTLKHAEDVSIFDLPKFGGGSACAAGIEQFCRAKKAADMFRAEG